MVVSCGVWGGETWLFRVVCGVGRHGCFVWCVGWGDMAVSCCSFPDVLVSHSFRSDIVVLSNPVSSQNIIHHLFILCFSITILYN